MWPHEASTWPEIRFGTILGCGALTIRTETQSDNHSTRDAAEPPPPNVGATRLIRILISEAAHLVWALRCERTIRGTEQTERTTEALWRKTINRRLSEDKIAAIKVLHKDDYIKLVKNTWKKH
ncbi:hypothetical protein EI94DRAFT_1848443 [Lactarius quietus]|nr:hypothetical protein EI94DRAFT_1848443 [Lactarius quietus]